MHQIFAEWKQFRDAYFRGAYPEFVLKAQLGKDVPVFVYHHVFHDEFEQRLMHLKRNGYSTLAGDDHHKALKDRNSVPVKSVVITFDDGLSDLYDIVFPLLKKYNVTIIVFLIAGWVGTPGLLTWDQIAEMHDSGLVDFQSHSMNHPAIYSSHKIIDFYQPYGPHFKLWNVPLKRISPEDCKMMLPELGAPIYGFSSRFSDEKRYLPDPKLDRSCENFVRRRGVQSFFTNKNWRDLLFRHVKEYKQQNELEDGFEPESDQITSILEELYLSKYKIERELENKAVRYFAFPWNEIGVLSMKMLEKCGYKTAYTGLVLNKNMPGMNDDVEIAKRVTGDFIICLPGEGRRSFRSVMFQKIKRRLRTGVTY